MMASQQSFLGIKACPIAPLKWHSQHLTDYAFLVIMKQHKTGGSSGFHYSCHFCSYFSWLD